MWGAFGIQILRKRSGAIVLILGIDTSGGQGSVALLQRQGEELLTLEWRMLSGGKYSEQLVPSIAGLLERHGFERSSIGLIASGQRSRLIYRGAMAIATVKGLAEAFATPVAAISVLEAIAWLQKKMREKRAEW